MSPADTDDRIEVVEEYAHDFCLVREHADGDTDKYHY